MNFQLLLNSISEVYHNGNILITYKLETTILVLISTLIYVGARYFSHQSQQTHIYTSPTYQSITDLFKFNISSSNLSSNNSVYLTKFKSDGWKALFCHFCSGFITYFTNDLTNIYYLCVSILLIYEYGDLRSLSHSLTLTCFAGFATGLHVYTMSQLLRNQSEINHKSTTKLVWKKGQLENGTYVDVKIEKNILHKNLVRGDLIRLTENDRIPADILLLEGNVKTMELELTGENVVLSKTGLNLPLQPTSQKSPLIMINHHQNEGLIITQDRHYSYTAKNMIFRGTQIVDQIAIGVVIETGNDCQIYRLNHDHYKRPTQIQQLIARILLLNLYLMLLLSSVTAVLIYAKSPIEGYSWLQLIKIVRKMILLFNAMVPLSLPFFFTVGSQIISKRIENKHQVTINRRGLMAFQVDPKYIVSDKTGTLTTGQMDLAAIIHNQTNLMSPTTNSNHILANYNQVLANILACTEIQTHSTTGKLLKNNLEEEILLTYMLEKSQSQLITNQITSDGTGQLIYKINNQIQAIDRLYYQPYNYQLEVKIAVVRNLDHKLILHIQGTPEAINKYSNQSLKNHLRPIILPSTPKNAYQREIAHACREITKDELHQLKCDPLTVLTNFTQASLYVFYDYLVQNVNLMLNSILNLDKHFTMLTGDKQSTSIVIGQTMGLIHSYTIQLVIETLDDLDAILTARKVNDLDCVVILNGRLLETLICSNKTTQLSEIINLTSKIIIYRASPSGKQLYVSFLQSWFRKEVMMLGDGLNDIAALMQSDVGLSVNHPDNDNVKKMSDIVITSVTQVPSLLVDFQSGQSIIKIIAQWVLGKHMMTPFMLLAILFLSDFVHMRDPTSPFWMNGMNALIFVCMYCFCQLIPLNQKSRKDNNYLMLTGAILGLINSYVVVYLTGIDQVDTGIKYCLVLQVFELMAQLIYLYTSN